MDEVQEELVVFTSPIESKKKKIQALDILHIHAFKIHIILIVQEHLSSPIVYV
jgi:hypothetical protein